MDHLLWVGDGSLLAQDVFGEGTHREVLPAVNGQW